MRCLALTLASMTGVPEWCSRVATILSHAVGRAPGAFVPRNAAPTVRREARIFVGCYAAIGVVSVWCDSVVLLHVWLIPYLLGGPFLRAYLLADLKIVWLLLNAGKPEIGQMLPPPRLLFDTGDLDTRTARAGAHPP